MISTPLLAFDLRSTFFYSAGGQLPSVANSPGGLISIILPNIIIAAGIIFFFLILLGGFGIIIGAGKQSSPQEAAKAKSALTTGVIGFLLVISAYFILQIVQTILGVPLINPVFT